MVDEVSGIMAPPKFVDGLRAKPNMLKIETVARAYEVQNRGAGMAKSSEFTLNPQIARLFDNPGEKVNKEGYEVNDIWNIHARNVFIFLVAIFYPDHKTRIFKNLAATIGAAYLSIREVNWAVLLYDTIRKQIGGHREVQLCQPLPLPLVLLRG